MQPHWRKDYDMPTPKRGKGVKKGSAKEKRGQPKNIGINICIRAKNYRTTIPTAHHMIAGAFMFDS